ncbi:hypothetical protein B484DRAFT_401285 [Ochromonadaceae sp. CCMP2298]|nr:hypothetical protein B484DRAFT_401285 [Ochromonadaceae sp. CCMP2298]
MKIIITSEFAQSPGDFVGKHVALWSPVNKRFLQMHENGNARRSSGYVGVLQEEQVNPGNLETWRTCARFQIIDAGNGQIALHHAISNRFLRLHGADVDGFGGVQDAHSLPVEWGCERFIVVPAGNLVALHSTCNKKFIRMKDNKVDAQGGRNDHDKLPLEWWSEQWEVVLHPLQTNRTDPIEHTQHTEHTKTKHGTVVVVAGSAVAAGSVPLIAVATVQAVGFTSGGIAAGSTAAAMMAAEAVAAGGGVAAGGTVATLQAVGAVAIKACNGRFLKALGGGRGNWWFDMMAGPCHTGVVKAEAERADFWEQFTVLPCEGELFALRSHHGAILHAEGGGRDIRAVTWHVQEREKFRFFESRALDGERQAGG